MHMITIGRAFAGITAGLLALFAYTAPDAGATTPKTDCTRVATTDRPLCATVRAQHAYGWTDEVGNPQNWQANGRALVHEITHGGYSKSEMHDALTGAHRDYRAYVTDISFNLDTLRKTCGHTHGAYGVQYIKGDDGHLYTWKQTICD